MYFTIIVCIIILFTSFIVFGFWGHKRCERKSIIEICILTFIIEMLYFFGHPIQGVSYDIVKITALGENNINAEGCEVFLDSISMHGVELKFPEVSEGKWFWLDGRYCWRPETDDRKPDGVTREIKLKIPVGTEREIVFLHHKWSGMVEIEISDFDECIDLYSEGPENISLKIPDSSFPNIIYNEIIRVVFFLTIHLVALVISAVFVKSALEKCIRLVDYCRYEIFFYIFSLFTLSKLSWYPNTNWYTSTFYFNSYELGFLKRGLVAELFTNLSPYWEKEGIACCKLVILSLFYLLLSVLVGKIVRRQHDERIRWFFVVLFLALPSTFIYIIDDVRLDIFLFVFFMVAVILISLNKCVWLVPILVTHMLLINETSCAFFMVPILGILLYRVWKTREKKDLCILVGTLVCGGTFTFKFLFMEHPWTSYEISNVITHIQKHTTELDYGALDAETWSLSRQISFACSQLAQHYKQHILFFLSLLPVLILFALIWNVLYQKTEKIICDWKNKVVFYLLALSPLSAFFIMVISIDYPRYSSFMINAGIVTIFFFIYEENIQLSFDNLSVYKGKVSFSNCFLIAICVFYLLFGSYQSTTSGISSINAISSFISSIVRA